MLLSIVIPIYNAQNLVNQLLNSILAQSFTDFEIIVVNDGSTDATEQTVRRIQESESRVKLFSICNSGPAAARNIGISQAKGDYILFVDSDDAIIAGGLKEIADEIQNTVFDILIFGYYITNTNFEVISINTYSKRRFGSLFEMACDFSSLYQHNQLNQVWNKVFRTKHLKEQGIAFCNYRYGEDRIFVLDALQEAKSVVIIDRPLYLYVNNIEGSLVTKYNTEKFEICCFIHDRITHFAKSIGAQSDKDKAIFDYMFLKNVVSCLVQINNKSCILKPLQKRDVIRGIINDKRIKNISKITDFGLTTRILLFVIRTKSINLNLLAASAVMFVSRNFPVLYIKNKHNYNLNVSGKQV